MTMKMPLRTITVLAAALALLSCQSGRKLSIRRNRDGQELSSYRLRSMTGLRDGDKLLSELVVADNQDTLTMRMKFQIGVPIKLESGDYVWQRRNAPQIQGSVRAESVIFQGNQNGPPSLGGTFQLVSNDVNLYEVRVPATLLDAPGKITAPDK